MQKYQFIAIEGNIGAGKTTLCQMLSQQWGARLLLEQFADNPFLPYFYENPERYAFPVELFFMTERHKQMQEGMVGQDLFQQLTISDYFFVKTLLFAKKNLKDEEYRLFQRLFQLLNAASPKPDLLVYLHRPVPTLQQNIQKRGRDYEKDISDDYLQQIQDAYFEFFKSAPTLPVLVVALNEEDFVEDAEVYRRLTQAFEAEYPVGVSYFTFEK